MKLDGAKELRNLITELPKRVESKALRKGLTVGSAPIKRAVKAGTPRRTGTLKRNIISKVSVKKGKGFSVTGARYIKGKNNPSRYLHLVEGGTRPHDIKQPKRRRTLHHPGTSGKGFVHNAERSTGPTAVRLVQGIMLSTVRAEAKKLGKL